MLAPKEIYTNFSNSYDTSTDLTRTLDYYTNAGVTTSSYSGAIKKYQSNATSWWLRSAEIGIAFSRIQNTGEKIGSAATSSYGVSPAFRIG